MSTATGANDGSVLSTCESASRQRISQQRSGTANRGRVNRGSCRDKPQHRKPLLKKLTGKEEALGEKHICQHTEGWDATDQHSRATEEII
jgi:hypothetical protein